MSDLSSSAPFEPAPRRATGLWLVGVLGMVVVVLGVMLIASATRIPEGLPTTISQPGIKADAPGFFSANSSLPGFERRGNMLVGEVTTRDGSALRLVFDARTKALIGLRRLETAPR